MRRKSSHRHLHRCHSRWFLNSCPSRPFGSCPLPRLNQRPLYRPRRRPSRVLKMPSFLSQVRILIHSLYFVTQPTSTFHRPWPISTTPSTTPPAVSLSCRDQKDSPSILCYMPEILSGGGNLCNPTPCTNARTCVQRLPHLPSHGVGRWLRALI
jgi:hypothetical protein